MVTWCPLLSIAMMLLRLGGTDEDLDLVEGRSITSRAVVDAVAAASFSSLILFSSWPTE